MRINYNEDLEDNLAILWQANCRRSLKGKAGQRALRELEAALLALPTKRLIAGQLDDGADVCAIGALARHKHVMPKADPEFEIEDVGVECGMPRLVAWKVVELNDIELGMSTVWREQQFVPYTPEERYDAVLAWTRDQLAGH